MTMNDETTKTGEQADAAKSRLPLMLAAAIVLILGGAVAGIAYYAVAHGRVYVEDASIEASQTTLAPTQTDTLKQVFVSPGDSVPANTVVAQVGTELIKTTNAAIVIKTDTDIGSQATPDTAVVTVVDPAQLKVVGQVKEDKGLADITVGDRAMFTVDAYGSKKFQGVVSEVSPTSHDSDVVFSVSDKREEKDFDVKVTYDRAAYPELKNGMSAKIWIYKN